MSNEMMKQELKEAIDAGERALYSLECARGKLDSAKNWGLFDLFGGGLIASALKHSKIEDAVNFMEDAKRNLRKFQQELQDVNASLKLEMEIGSFLSFADFFFDGFVADYLVQSKIEDAREQVNDAIQIVENLLRDLKRQMSNFME